MRPAVRVFIDEVASAFDLPEPIVEIGARPAEGQEEIANLRGLFVGRDFVGCDIQEGPGVDRVEDVHALSFPDESVGTVISLDTLEHVADPIRALTEIHRVLRPGGIVVISSVMFFVIHAHPWDYWRFTPEGFALLLEPFEQRLVLAQGDERIPENVFGIGIKGPRPALDRSLLPRTVEACERWGEGKPVELGPMRMSLRQLWGFTLRQTREVLLPRRGNTVGGRGE